MLNNNTIKYGVGTKAYYDSFRFGLIPCVVTEITTNECGGLTIVKAKLTANRGEFNTYKRGEIVDGTVNQIVPRSHVFQRDHYKRIRGGYEWVA